MKFKPFGSIKYNSGSTGRDDKKRHESVEDAVDRLLSNPSAFDDLRLGPGEEPGVCLFCMTPTAYTKLPNGDIWWNCSSCGRTPRD